MIKNLFNKKYTVATFEKLLFTKPIDLKEIQKAIDSGIDIHKKDNKNTYLHKAIEKNLSSCAELLINNGIDVILEDNNNHTPIFLAISKGNRTITQALLKTKKIDLDQLHGNRSLIQDAVIHGERQILQLILEYGKGSNINHIDAKGRNIIFDAVIDNNEQIIDIILTVDNLNLNILDGEGQTILHLKQVFANDELAKKLIQHGANPTILGNEEKSYLLHVVLDNIGTEDIVTVAVESGFDLNTPLKDNNSILMEITKVFIATDVLDIERREHLISMTRVLLEHEADANFINNEKESVLSKLVYRGVLDWDLTSLFLQYGADLSHQNRADQTIVEIISDLTLFTHENIHRVSPDIDTELIAEGAQYIIFLQKILDISEFNINIMSSEDEPLFFKSLLFGHRPLFTLYCKYKIRINSVNRRGNNLFSRYVGKMSSFDTLPKDFREVVGMLVDKKISVNAQDKNGKTMLSKLITANNMQAFRVLFDVTHFDYMLTDNRGFTILHNCISSSNLTIIKLVDANEPKLKNIPDNMGILPITYAALFGQVDLVLEFIALESTFSSNKPIPKTAKVKFIPLLANLNKLVDENPNKQHLLDTLKEQILKDFT